MLTARGRNKALQAGLAAGGHGRVDLGLHALRLLRRDLPERRPQREDRAAPPARARRRLGDHLAGTGGRRDRAVAAVAGARARVHDPRARAAPHPLDRRVPAANRPSVGPAPTMACCGSLEVEAGRAMPSRVKAGVVADPVCLEQYDAEFLGPAGHAASRPLRSRAALLLLRAPPDRESRPRPRVSALRRAPPPLRLRHERRSEPSRAIDVRRLGAGAVRARRARHPRGGRPSAGALAGRADHHLLARRLPGVQEPTRAARRASSRSACVERDQDRRPHHRREPRRAPPRPSARSTPAFARSSLERKSSRATRSAPASSRRAATPSSARISASRPTTRFTRPSGSPASTSSSRAACSCRCRSSRDRRRTSIASTPTTTS